MDVQFPILWNEMSTRIIGEKGTRLSLSVCGIVPPSSTTSPLLPQLREPPLLGELRFSPLSSLLASLHTSFALGCFALKSRRGFLEGSYSCLGAFEGISCHGFVQVHLLIEQSDSVRQLLLRAGVSLPAGCNRAEIPFIIYRKTA